MAGQELVSVRRGPFFSAPPAPKNTARTFVPLDGGDPQRFYAAFGEPLSGLSSSRALHTLFVPGGQGYILQACGRQIRGRSGQMSRRVT
jgi:hypothetical protein